MNDAVITLNGLEKRFPGMDKPAVAPLDCTIHAGYVTGLVGPDGAGKTTLMRMLAGLLKPDSGSATVIGFDPIKNDGALHAVLGYMPQKFGLYEDLTVMENLVFAERLRGGEAGDRLEWALVALDLIGLSAREVRTLSAGQRRRTALARIVLSQAPLWLLDEPLNALDAPAQAAFRTALQRHLAAGGLAIAATHADLGIEGAQRLDLRAGTTADSLA